MKDILIRFYYLVESADAHKADVGEQCSCVRCDEFRSLKDAIDRMDE